MLQDILNLPAVENLIIPDSSNAFSIIGARGTAPITRKVNLSVNLRIDFVDNIFNYQEETFMLFIWRGYGWLVPVIVIAGFLAVQSTVDGVLGDGYYKSHDWAKYMALSLSVILIGLLGYLVNYRKRVVVLDAETGKSIKSPAHALFFIPIEYWAFIIPLVVVWATGASVS